MEGHGPACDDRPEDQEPAAESDGPGGPEGEPVVTVLASRSTVAGPRSLRPGDVVVRSAAERVVAKVLPSCSDTVVCYRDGGPDDVFGLGTTLMVRRVQ